MINEDMKKQMVDLILSIPLDSWKKNSSDAWETELNNCRIYIWKIESGQPFWNKFVIDGVDFVVKEATTVEGLLNTKEAERKLAEKNTALFNVVICRIYTLIQTAAIALNLHAVFH